MDSQKEEWRVIPGFSSYEVSNYGRVRSGRIKGVKRIFRSNKERLKWYPQVTLCRDSGERDNWFIHRLVAFHFLDDYGPNMMVLHKDGDRTNNNVTNLKMGMHADNAADAIRHGTLARGENHGNAKLTSKDVEQIKRLLAKGELQTIIAKQFGVTKHAISHISRGNSWKHIS